MGTYKNILRLALVAMFLSCGAAVFAADGTWTGGGGSDTSLGNVNNWNPKAVPGNGWYFASGGYTATADTDRGGGPIYFNSSNDFTINGSGLLTFYSSVNKTGGANYTFACPTKLGTTTNVTNSSASGLLTFSGNLNMAGSTLQISGDGTTYINSITNPGTIAKGGAGTVILSSSSIYTGTASVLAGTLRGAIKSGSVGYGAFLDMNMATDYVGSVTGSGTLVKSGSGVLTFSADQKSLTGGMIIKEGTVRLGAGNLLYPTLTMRVAGGTFDLNGTDTTIGQLTLSGGAITGGGTLRCSSFYAYEGVLGSSVYPSGTSFYKLGTGTLTIAVSNAAYNGMMIDGGKVIYGANNVMGSSYAGLRVSEGTVLDMGSYSDVVGLTTVYDGASILGTGTLTKTSGSFSMYGATVNVNLAGAAALTKYGSGTLVLTGSNSFTGNVSMNAGTLKGSVAAINNKSVEGASGTVLEFAQNTDATYSNVVSGSGVKMVKSGSGILTLTNISTYTGSTTVTEGTLKYGASNAVGTGPMIVNGGTLDLGNFSDTVGAVTLSSGAIAGTGRLTGTSFAVEDGTISAILDDTATGGLTKTGTGTVRLTAANLYNGPTTVSAGTLIVDGNIATSSGVTVADGATMIGAGNLGAVVTSVGSTLGGTVHTGLLSGSGMIAPGNSPGIMTATQINPASGLDWSFDITAFDPNYASATSSANDVLRITDASTPFTAALTSDNVINVYFNMAEITTGDLFTGGFYTDKAADFLSSLSNATYNYYLTGKFLGGNGYFDVSTVQRAASFSGGSANGYVMEFKALHDDEGTVPEPSTLLLLLPLIGFGMKKLRGKMA